MFNKDIQVQVVSVVLYTVIARSKLADLKYSCLHLLTRCLKLGQTLTASADGPIWVSILFLITVLYCAV